MSAKVKPVVAPRSSDSFSKQPRRLEAASSAVSCVPESFRIGMCSSTIRKKRHLYLQRCVVPNDSL